MIAVVYAHQRLHAADVPICEVGRGEARGVGVQAPVGVDHHDDRVLTIAALGQRAIGVIQRFGLALARRRQLASQNG